MPCVPLIEYSGTARQSGVADLMARACAFKLVADLADERIRTVAAMAFISIKRYLDIAPTETHQRQLALLVEAVMQRPLDIEPAECERFKAEVARIQEAFSAEPTEQQLIRATASIGYALERLNDSAADVVSRQETELQSMVAMLAQTIKYVGAASDNSVRNLESIAGELKQASTLNNLQALRLRLEGCLKNVLSEATRQRSQSQSSIQALKQELEATQERLLHHGLKIDFDRVTGFAGRGAAEVAIHDIVRSAEAHYIAVAVLGKMPAINSRFGYVVGDEVLCEFAGCIAGKLCSRAAFYRWSGPTIVGILQRTDPLHMVRAEVSAAAEPPMYKTVVSGGQNAMINTSAVCLVLPVAPPASDLITRIDTFVAAQIPKDYMPSPA